MYLITYKADYLNTKCNQVSESGEVKVHTELLAKFIFWAFSKHIENIYNKKIFGYFLKNGETDITESENIRLYQIYKYDLTPVKQLRYNLWSKIEKY